MDTAISQMTLTMIEAVALVMNEDPWSFALTLAGSGEERRQFDV